MSLGHFTLAIVVALALAPSSALAFSHGDVPNVASDKRAHEPPKERLHEAEHEGGTYHRPKGARASWWDNEGHEHHDAVYTSRSHGSGRDDSGRSSRAGSHVQHLAGGATVSDAPARSRGRSKRTSNEP